MRRCAVVWAVAAVLLASCGSGDDDDGGGGAGGTRAGTATTVASNSRAPGVPQADVDAIEQLRTYLDEANAAGKEQWLTALAASNYVVWSGGATAEQCVEHTRRQLGILANARLTTRLDLSTLRAASGPNPIVGAVPQGRPYTVEARVTFAPRNGGRASDPVVAPMSVVVVPDGTAKHISPCA